MKVRCKDGDLVIVTRDEPGLEENLGKFLWVNGPPLKDRELGTVFVTLVAGTEPMLTLCRDGSIESTMEWRYHPDAWMVPVWRPSPKERRKLRAPLRNLPKLSREWLDQVMRGYA